MVSNREISSADNQQENNILESLVKAAPNLQKLVPFDCMIGVTDKNKFIGHVPGDKMKIGENIIGMPIPPGDAIYEAIRTGQTTTIVVPEQAFGFSFKETGIPIKDTDGKVIGGMGLGVSLENQYLLLDVPLSTAVATQKIMATTQELTATALHLADGLTKAKSSGEKVLVQIKKTDSILELINDISANSNLLGLNAAIKATQVGEQGSGFAVVAEEIRKMAINSAASIKNIKDIIDIIKVESGHMINLVTEASKLGEQQAVASEQISAYMDELSLSAENISKVDKILLTKMFLNK